jgi:hypothetical protein
MGRAATCLRQRLAGKGASMAEAGAKPCRVDVTKFFSAARKDITKYNAALAKSCAAELGSGGVCANAATGQAGDFADQKATPFACLKKKKKRLSEACAAEVFQEQVEEAEDVRYKPRGLAGERLEGMCWLWGSSFFFLARARWLSVLCFFILKNCRYLYILHVFPNMLFVVDRGGGGRTGWIAA